MKSDCHSLIMQVCVKSSQLGSKHFLVATEVSDKGNSIFSSLKDLLGASQVSFNYSFPLLPSLKILHILEKKTQPNLNKCK